ncbi:MAG: xylose transporter, permease protein XylH [Myxococcales bacterium]|nr:xylose transporter, permease protein XylH [Myxococcales bacterium]
MTIKLERSVEQNRLGAKPTRLDLKAWVMAGVLVVMWATLALLPATRGVFLSQGNIATLLVQSSVLLVISVGMTMVVLVRGIDLSVGAGVALTGVVAALAQIKLGLPAPVAIAMAIGAGAAIGAIHGLWIGWLGIPAFMVTLAGFKAYRGISLVLADAKGLAPMHDDFSVLATNVPPAATWIFVLAALAGGVALTLRDATRRKTFGLEPTTTTVVIARIGGQVLLAALILVVFGTRGVPVPVIVAGAVALWGVFVTRRTRFGRHLYAIGGNPEAARLSGIDVKRTTLIVYILLGVLTAIASMLLAARVNGVTPGSQGAGLELDAVTAVVIGGTSITGGRGSVAGTVLGTLVFATLANGMNHLGINSNWQLICTGAILLLAVLIDVLSKGRRS